MKPKLHDQDQDDTLLASGWMNSANRSRGSRRASVRLRRLQHAAARLLALRDAVRRALPESRFGTAVTAGFVQRLKDSGMRIREYQPEAGGSVMCTIAPDDDFIVSRLRAPLAGVRQLDLVWEDSGMQHRLGARALRSGRNEVFFIPRSRWCDRWAPRPTRPADRRDPGLRAGGRRVHLQPSSLGSDLESVFSGRRPATVGNRSAPRSCHFFRTLIRRRHESVPLRRRGLGPGSHSLHFGAGMLAACGGGGSDTRTVRRQFGRLTLRITDSPVTSAKRVWSNSPVSRSSQKVPRVPRSLTSRPARSTCWRSMAAAVRSCCRTKCCRPVNTSPSA